MPTALDADQFTDAFAQHGRALWVLAAAWVGRGDAADLVQEVARLAWQSRDRFTPGTDLRAWLSQFVRHTGANWRRQRRPQLHDPAVTAEPVATAPVLSLWPFDADRHGLSDELAQALRSLNETARACLLLHIVGDLSLAEVGSMLELPPNTVASHVRRAREHLRTTLFAKPQNVMPLPGSP